MSVKATNYYFIDKMLKASEENGVSAKYVKHGEYMLTRYEAAKIVQEILHLISMPCDLKDVDKNDMYADCVGAVLHYGIMSAPEGRFDGGRILSTAEADEIVEAAGKYQKELRASYKPFVAVALQFNPRMYEKECNTVRLYNEFEKALKKGAKLVVAPEASISAYYYNDRDDIKQYTETIPGPSTDLFCELAKRFDAYLSYGLIEEDPDTGDYYNSAVLIGPEGCIGKYRKIHQWEVEKHFAADGNVGVPVFSTKLGYISMIICIDAYYYASARLAAVNGADILIYNTCDKGESVWAIASRSIQNGVYVVSANRSGEEAGNNIIGGSAIYDPYAHKLAEAEVTPPGVKETAECEQIEAMIDPKLYSNPGKALLFDRMPEKYKEISLNISPWNGRRTTVSKKIEALSVQYEPTGNINDNKAKIEHIVEDAFKDNRMINLIALPEMSLLGPLESAEDYIKNAEALEGPTMEFLAEMAKIRNSVVVYTLPEKNGKKYYHTAVVINRDGKIAGRYRKINLNQQEKEWAVSGSKIDNFTTDIGRVGVIIGDEYLFPEIADVILIKRPDIVVMPVAYIDGGGRIEADQKIVVRKYPDNAVLLFDQTAQYLQTGLVVANYAGTSLCYEGGSGMYVPDPIYGRDIIQLAGFKECGFVSRYQTLTNKDYWMNQDIMTSSRKPWYYTPLIV